MYSNDLIFGVNKTTNIVAVEPVDNGLVLFKEVNGEVIHETIDNKYWLITNDQVSSKQIELEGNQHFKYLSVFETEQQKKEVKKLIKQESIEYWDISNPQEASMVINGVTYFKGLNPRDVSILFFDIETTGLKHDENSRVLLISNTFRKNDKLVKKLFAYDEYKSQKQLLDAWSKWVREMNPSIMCGHNIFGFDLPYMQFCAKMSKTYLKLGRDGSSIKFKPYTSKYRVSGSMDIEYFDTNIFGRNIIDTMFLSYKYDFSKKYESYGLKSIIKTEGLEKKDRVFYDAGEIRHNYTNPDEWIKIKAYAIDDADDAMSLYDLMIPSYFYVTQSVSKTFQQIMNSATGSQLNNVMVRSYLQNGHSIAKASEIIPIKGGISFAVPGVYRNLYKIDIKSCYPSQILRFKLHDKKKDPLANFYNMVHYFTYKRFDYKKSYKETGDIYYKNLDASAKEFINSAYGLCTTPGLNYNANDIGAKITHESREVIDMALSWASGYKSDYWFDIFNKAVGKDE